MANESDTPFDDGGGGFLPDDDDDSGPSFDNGDNGDISYALGERAPQPGAQGPSRREECPEIIPFFFFLAPSAAATNPADPAAQARAAANREEVCACISAHHSR